MGLSNYRFALIDCPAVSVSAAQSRSSADQKRVAEGRLFFDLLTVLSAAKMSCPVAPPDSLADTRVSGLPSLTEDQRLSRNLTGFQLQTETAEASRLGDLATMRLSPPSG